METQVREKPILFSGEMVKGILDGRKTQTRRIVKPQFSKTWGHGVRRGDDAFSVHVDIMEPDGTWKWIKCPFGQPGDRLRVNESFYVDLLPWANGGSLKDIDRELALENIYYRADGECCHQIPECTCAEVGRTKWRTGRFMPRWASRITLEVTGIRVESLQEISHSDALAEGVSYDVSKPDGGPVARFRALWDSINGKTHPWKSDPFVWVIEFRKL